MHTLLCLTGPMPKRASLRTQQAYLAINGRFGFGGQFTRAQAVAAIMGSYGHTKHQALNAYNRLWRAYCFTHAICWLGWLATWAPSCTFTACYPWAVATPRQRAYWASQGCLY